MNLLRYRPRAIDTRIIICGSRRSPVETISLLTRSIDAKARYKPPHAPGAAYSPSGRRIKDWEARS